MKNIAVLYEDDECMVLDKPAGLAVQGGEQVGASLDALLGALREPRPLLVHRLDKDTSGAILVAKTREAASRYGALMAGRGVSKRYLAVCAGRPGSPSGEIREPLEIRGELKESRTRYRTLASSGALSLLELELDTGRMHQIRRHLAGRGNPILGDDKYGDFALNKRLRKERGVKRLLLHSFSLGLPKAVGRPVVVIAPPPAHFLPFLEEFGLDFAALSCL